MRVQRALIAMSLGIVTASVSFGLTLIQPQEGAPTVVPYILVSVALSWFFWNTIHHGEE